MKENFVNIHRIESKKIKNPNKDKLYVCWVQEDVKSITINGEKYANIKHAIVFLNRNLNWEITRNNTSGTSGYIMDINPETFSNPVLSKLHISQLQLFNTNEIPIINLSPGIAKRTQAILEMIDELLGSELNHKNEAILSLLNTFFVYCDGQCNIKQQISNTGAKSNLVYKFKKLVDKHLSTYHEVSDYAKLLHVTPKYLNECVKDVLGYTAKGIIAEQLLMQSRNKLKFSNYTIKEISYQLGFSSPEYFSYFFKNHTGISPSALRKS